MLIYARAGTSCEDGLVRIIDSSAFYEIEIGDWRCHYNRKHNEIYTCTYLRYHVLSRHYVLSEPKRSSTTATGCTRSITTSSTPAAKRVKGWQYDKCKFPSTPW